MPDFPTYDMDLHYHDHERPGDASHWKTIPRGTWLQDGEYLARRAMDEHIYDVLVDHDGQVYFWKDGAGWYPEPGAKYSDAEEAKAVISVLLRLKAANETTQ